MKIFAAFLSTLAFLLLVMTHGAPVARGAAAAPITDTVGVNVVVNDTPSDIAQVAGWVRDYHKWYWYEPSPGVYTWSTGWQHLDSFYGALKGLGVNVMPVVEFAPTWATSNGQYDGVPDPNAHAQYLGALASHYGNTIAAIENYNEPNQWWQSVPFPASNFGAMTAQDYAAVKAANANLPLVLAGMAGPDTNYLDQANQASGGKFDVVNFHWYAQGDNTNGGTNPESGSLFNQIDTMKTWRDANAPGKPLWITEFGWDTFAQPNSAKSIIYAPEPDAANYLLRALFLMQGRGVDKSFIYVYRDPTSNPSYLQGTYNSSGLVTDNAETDGRKKPSWYYLATLKNVLGNYAFDSIVSNGPNVYDYLYTIPGTTKRAEVLWARNGDRDNGYQTTYHGPAGTLVVPVDGSTTGQVSTTNGNLTLTETPVFVLYDSVAGSTATPTQTATSAPATPTNSPTSVPSATSTVTPVATATLTPTATPTPVPSATATATIVPTATPGQPGGGSVNLVTNPGFESGLTGWDRPSWFAGVADVDSSVVHSGSSSFEFTGQSSGPYLQQDVPVTPGQRLTFSAWVNVAQRQSDMSGSIDLTALNTYHGENGTYRAYSFSSATNGWVHITATQTVPANTAWVRINVNFGSLDGTVYLDDFSITAQ